MPFGYTLGTFWVQFGYSLGTFWVQFGYILGTLWVHLMYILVHFGGITCTFVVQLWYTFKTNLVKFDSVAMGLLSHH